MATLAISPAQDAVLAEIHIAAPPERVFEAIADPNQVKQWWGQKGRYRHTDSQSDFRPGGKWRTLGVGDDGKEYEVGGEYVEVDPPRLLVYTWVASFDGYTPTTVRWELSPHQNGTMVRLRHSGFAQKPEASKHYSGGWPTVLGWMQAYVEKGETVETRKAAV